MTHMQFDLFCPSAVGGESGLFKADEDPKKGRWLETERALDYYGLKNGVREGRERGGVRRGKGKR